MYVMANTHVSILRGTEEDAYGDETDTDDAVATGILANISQSRMNVFDPATRTARIVRAYRASLPHGTDVRVGDRLKDENDSTIYTINSVTTPTTPGFLPDLQLELERTTA